MGNKDLAIIYKAKQKEANDIIKKLNSSSIDLSDKYKEIKLVDKELKERLKKEDSIDIYEESIKKIDLIINDIKDNYECYYKIYVLYKDLKQKLSNENEESINELVLLSKELLTLIKQSSTIEYEKEQELVLKVYKVIYRVLKLELLYSNSDSLLKLLKESYVDASFISELIEKDLNSIENNNQSVEQELIKVQKNGLDNKNLLNKDLLSFIIMYDKENVVKKKKEEFLSNVLDYDDVSKKMKKTIDEIETKSEEISKCKKSIRKLKRKKFMNVTLSLANLALMGIGLYFSPKLSEKISKDKQYHITTITYDSSIDEEVVDEYYSISNNENLTIVEYSPWDNPGYFRSDYKRNKYEYNTKNLNFEFDNLKDYLNNNIEFLDNDIQKSEEVVDKKPDDYGYTENKYVITKAKTDLDDYNYVVNQKYKLFYEIILGLFIVCINIESLFYIKDKNKNEKKEIANKKAELEKLKKESEKIKDKLQELLTKHNNMPKELLESYYDLGPVITKDTKVKEAKEKINKLINS